MCQHLLAEIVDVYGFVVQINSLRTVDGHHLAHFVSSFTVLVLGTSTSIPDCRIGAVIMKIISNTSKTSMNGTILMSASVESVPRCICGMACLGGFFYLLSSI